MINCGAFIVTNVLIFVLQNFLGAAAELIMN